MRSRFALLASLAIVLSLATTPPRAAAQATNPELLTQVQAADVLSDLITYTVQRADARLQNAQQFLRETGKEAAFEKARPAGQDTLLPFTSVFQAAVLFVKGDGAKFADP